MNTRIGIKNSVVADATAGQSCPPSPMMKGMKGGMVCAWPEVSSTAKAYSFQAKIRQKIAVAAMPVVACGSTTVPAFVQQSAGAALLARSEDWDWALVRLADVPRSLTDAILATEDRDFYRHAGVSVRRILGAMAANLRGASKQGGSTLTQQLARAIFLSPRKTISRKINEAFVAFEIERRYSKDQILTMYANEIYLGHGNYGVEAACRYYFGKSVKDVTLAEAALLVSNAWRYASASPGAAWACLQR